MRFSRAAETMLKSTGLQIYNMRDLACFSCCTPDSNYICDEYWYLTSVLNIIYTE